MEKAKAPGLKWRKLAGGLSPVWVADEADVRAGYRPKTINLRHAADDPDLLVAHCNAAQTDMLLWRVGHRRDPLAFDGRVASLLSIYEIHERSPFRRLKPGSLRPYVHYLGRLRGHIGAIRLDDISGVDILDWHDFWSDGGDRLAAAGMCVSVLSAALSFGVMLRLEGCDELLRIVRETSRKLPKPRARTESARAEAVVALRAAAHAAGRPSRALAYALVFETTLRLWDVIGQWWPIDREGVSDVVDAGRREKWFGLRWEDIGPDQVLRYMPSKTDSTTGATIAYSIAKAPMVLEELRHWPQEMRAGPIVVSENSGRPYQHQNFRRDFRADRKAAKDGGADVAGLWARDLRASAVSEARAGNVSTDDAAKVAGHSSRQTTERVYDRAVLEAADRFAEARVRHRERSGNGGGNAR